jgi:non-specific serine/threonine protein kinase
MNPEPWKQVEKPYDAGEREAGEQTESLHQPHAGDAELPALPSLVGCAMGNYLVLSRIGAGGMGEVYRGKDTRLNRDVAIKVLARGLAGDSEALGRLHREAKALAALNHPNICTIYEINDYEGRAFVVMELVDGETLDRKIIRQPLETSEIFRIAAQIADALDTAHEKQIVHRDIKPSNIMINARGQVKVLDFGLAKVIESNDHATSDQTTVQTEAGIFLGTVNYMSPEQASGQEVDHRTDLFSLGVVLYEMSARRLPFKGSTVQDTILRILTTQPEAVTQWNPRIPPRLEDIIMRCLQKDRGQRYATAQELVKDLAGPESERLHWRGGPRHNLPLQLTHFVGREREIGELGRLLTKAGVRLLTLTGSGGIGKSRLALEAAVHTLTTFPDGVWFADLASLSDQTLVPQTVAYALGLREERERSIAETLVNHLKARDLLLLLDSCEHLIPACAPLADTLLRACPNLRIVVTSREVLSIAGETVFRVPSLTLPNEEQHDVDSLRQSEAVQLFINRAAAVQPAFALTVQSGTAVAQICIRLDGIPLAIELAASRVKVLSVEQIRNRLQDRFSLLTGGSRTALPRHQTLQATIDWSYSLLTEAERMLFRRLSVFSGGWTLEAAETVCTGNGVEQADVIDLLSGLVDKSLVSSEEHNGHQRYELLVTLQQYAQKLLSGTEESQTVLRRHAEFFLAFAEEAEEKLKGSDQREWLDRFSRELDNVRAVLNWSLERDAEIGLRLVGAFTRFWRIRGHLSEARRWLSEVLARTGPFSDEKGRAKALGLAGRFAWDQGDYLSARSLSEQALALSERLGDKMGIARSLGVLGMVVHRQGDYAAAAALHKQSLTIFQELGDKRGITLSLNNLGNAALRQCDYVQARSLYQESLVIWRELDDRDGIAFSLGNLGNLSERQGDYPAARALYEESLAIFREFNDRDGIARSLGNLGTVATQEGDYLAARALLEESVAIRRRLGDKYGLARSLGNLGNLAERQGDHALALSSDEERLAISRELADEHGIAESLGNLGKAARRRGDFSASRALLVESLSIRRKLGDAADIAESLESMATLELALLQNERAMRLWGAAHALRAKTAVPLPPSDREEYQRKIAAALAAIGQDAFNDAWSQGEVMAVDEAIAYALRLEQGG